MLFFLYHIFQQYLVTEFEPEEFSLFLEYLHNGLCIIYPEVLPSLLCIADHYEVDALVKSCLESFEDLATPSSVSYVIFILYLT